MERGTSKRRQRLDQRFPPTHIVRLTGKEIPGASDNISTAFLRLLAVFLQNFNRISTIVRLVKVTRGSTIVLHPYTNCDFMKQIPETRSVSKQYFSSIFYISGDDDVDARGSDDERGIFILVKIISIRELAYKIHSPIRC